MRSKDTKIAAVKLPRCLRGGVKVEAEKTARKRFEETGAPWTKELDTKMADFQFRLFRFFITPNSTGAPLFEAPA